jgi:hypothetical protein
MDAWPQLQCKCERCGQRPWSVAVSDPYDPRWEYSETLYCDDCYQEVFGRAPAPRGDLH